MCIMRIGERKMIGNSIGEITLTAFLIVICGEFCQAMQRQATREKKMSGQLISCLKSLKKQSEQHKNEVNNFNVEFNYRFSDDTQHRITGIFYYYPDLNNVQYYTYTTCSVYMKKVSDGRGGSIMTIQRCEIGNQMVSEDSLIADFLINRVSYVNINELGPTLNYCNS